jgi:aminoglycoside phosphotransferase family enzyme
LIFPLKQNIIQKHICESDPTFVPEEFQLIELFLAVVRLLKKQHNYLAKIVMKGFIDFSGVF